MKVYIGPYHHWFAPYRWAKKLLRWWNGFDAAKRLNLEQYEKVDEFARKNLQWLRAIEEWFDARYTRKVKVSVAYYDTWGMDATLTPIILPLLKQLKATKNGSPLVDDEDVPDGLKSTSAAPLTDAQKAMGYEDNNVHARWNWVMGEMIWAFEQLADDEAESQFHTDIDPNKPSDEPGIEFAEAMRRGKFDKDGYMAWQERKSRGLRLFGKYFEALWD
jgi:hypothetical protein